MNLYIIRHAIAVDEAIPVGPLKTQTEPGAIRDYDAVGHNRV